MPGIQIATAQNVNLTTLPPAGPNERFYKDLLVEKRPALSFNGFSCRMTDSCVFGYGVAEVLEAVYNVDPDPAMVPVHNQLLEWAELPVDDSPPDRTLVIDNTRILQSRAAVALFSVLLEGNGYQPEKVSAPGVHALPPPNVAMARLLDAMRFREGYRINGHMTDDAVKWTATVSNLARALDLYLALENAVVWFSSASSRIDIRDLPTCTEKASFLDFVARQIERLDELGRKTVIFRISADDLQPGNWPMKVQLAVAYASLAQQSYTTDSCGPVPQHSYRGWLERGIRSAGSPTQRNRTKHWNYQTGGGQRYFAEGPYYLHLSLSELIPFWHSIRLNGLLSAHPDLVLDDPFRSDWFLRPVEWLADTVTPDGRILPFDDGNRKPMDHSGLLRWDDTYGDRDVGRKYAWISDQPANGLGADANALVVELAIPRLAGGRGSPPVPDLGVISRGSTDRTPEQVAVVRRRSVDIEGEDHVHFLALNGEYGDAIGRGEGHEQPDQLQLVYYIDGWSILLDSGYDNASGTGNSTWNHYFDHNVLMITGPGGNGEGGLPPPFPDLLRARIVASHSDAEFLGLTSEGRIDVLSGRILLDPDDSDSGSRVQYNRTVLFVGDETAPYVIDINEADSPGESFYFRTSYHFGGVPPVLSGRVGSEGIWQLGDLELRVTTFGVGGSVDRTVRIDDVEESYQENIPIGRLDIENPEPSRRYSSIAFISVDIEGISGKYVPASWPSTSADTASETSLYVWRRDSGSIDVLAVRTPQSVQDRPLQVSFVIDGTDFILELAEAAPFGFTRLRPAGSTGRWNAVPDFQYDMVFVRSVSTFSPVLPDSPVMGLTVGPNPVDGRANIRYDVPSNGWMKLSVFDILGREVSRLLNGYRSAGTYNRKWDRGQLANGVYVLRLESERDSRSVGIILNR